MSKTKSRSSKVPSHVSRRVAALPSAELALGASSSPAASQPASATASASPAAIAMPRSVELAGPDARVGLVPEHTPEETPPPSDALQAGPPPAQMNALLPLMVMAGLLLLVIVYGALTSGN